MSTLSDFDAIVAELIGKGAPRYMAERAACRHLGLAEPPRAGEGVGHAQGGKQTPRQASSTAQPVLDALLANPFRVSLPWSTLIPDNERFIPVIRPIKGVPKAIQILTDPYKAARGAIRALVADAWGERPILDAPLYLHAAVWLPDNRRHDASNFGKGVLDAIQGVIYVDDNWLYDTRWTKMGKDVDRPRADLTIGPWRGV